MQSKSLAELKAAKAAREQSRAIQVEALQVKALELEEKFEKELGPIGVAFEVVDVSDLLLDPIVVKRGLAVTFKQFSNSKVNEEDVDAYVTASLVHPPIEEYRKTINAHPALGIRCALAVSKLHGTKIEQDTKKA